LKHFLEQRTDYRSCGSRCIQLLLEKFWAIHFALLRIADRIVVLPTFRDFARTMWWRYLWSLVRSLWERGSGSQSSVSSRRSLISTCGSKRSPTALTRLIRELLSTARNWLTVSLQGDMLWSYDICYFFASAFTAAF